MMSNSLLELEKNPHNLNEVNIILRGAHTLKGMSAAMGFKNISELTHKMEDILTNIKSGFIELDFNMANVLFKCIDILTLIVNTIDDTENEDYDISSLSDEMEKINLNIEKDIQPKEIITCETDTVIFENAKATNEKSDAENIYRNIKVDIDKLYEIMNLVSEVIAQRLNLEQLAKSNRLTYLNDVLEEMMMTTSKLKNLIEDISMMPLETVLNRFPRMMRDLSLELNKEINFTIKGKETKMDRTVIEEIGEPLIQVLRNAIDHGIESREERIRKGKDPIGNINITAYQEGTSAIIKISDDGRGIDVEVSMPDGKELDKDQVKKLIFTQGFSTKNVVTNISGRGVGMNIVKSKIDELGGTIDFHSIKGKGSTFIIKIPLTLRILSAIIIKIGEDIFAIPISYIYRIIKAKEVSIECAEGRRFINYMGKHIPIIDICENEKYNEESFVVMVKVRKDILAILADDLLEQREIAVKPFGKPLCDLKEYIGATILMNGKVALILNIDAFKEM